MGSFIKFNKIILKFMWKNNRLRIVKNFEEKLDWVEGMIFGFFSVLYSNDY